MSPLLGFIPKKVRTQEQHDAHAAAESLTVKYTLPRVELAKGEAVRLTDLWSHPDVVADVGFKFDRIHQLTGSCVGAGGCNALFSTIAAQRVAADKPTKAFLPFWLAPYAMSRHYMGDDGQGDGSMGSTYAKTLTTDGVRDWVPGTDGMPPYTDEDGITVSGSSVEMKWSSYRNSDLAKILTTARQHILGSAGICRTTQDIEAMIQNGKGVAIACNDYIGNGSIKGEGENAYVRGKWDNRGGHQQSIHNVWHHPTDGKLFWAQNNWPGSTYPKDPAGGPICGVWVAEADVQYVLDHLDAECYGFSNLPWFEAIPNILNWVRG
jgi:hypothetical protein